MDEYIKISNYSKSIKGHQILDNVNLSLDKGKIYGLKGRNGSGKTMLMRAICGFINPDKGEVIVNNVNITKEKAIPKKVGAIIDNVGFLNYLDGFTNLKLLAEIQNNIDDEKIKYYMNRVGLNPSEKKHVRSYSLGMKQKLGIVQAIMEEPELVLLDEATNGLDDEGVKIFYELVLELKKRNATVILTNHNYDELKEVCDEIIEIDGGKIKSRYETA